MHKLVLIFLFSITYVFSNTTIGSFSKSKKLLKKIYKEHQITFYAQCNYTYKSKKNMIDRDSCGYTPRNEYTKKGKINKRARRIEWEHIIPAENFGRQFTCWREGHTKCVTKNGKTYKGRKCCSKVNQKFKYMESDLHNLVPTIGELNADRSNFRFGMIEGEKRRYGKNIDFEVDFKTRQVEPRNDIKGNIARTYFYFEDTYNMKISKQQRKIFKIWNKMDPIDKWEIQRNKKIQQIQENFNPYIKDK